MTTHSGEMTTTNHSNPQWVLADGKPYYFNDPKRAQRVADTAPSTGNRLDYLRRVGRQGRRRGLGPLGFIFCVPFDPSATYYVSLADDAAEAPLTNPPTVAKPPAGVK